MEEKEKEKKKDIKERGSCTYIRREFHRTREMKEEGDGAAQRSGGEGNDRISSFPLRVHAPVERGGRGVPLLSPLLTTEFFFASRERGERERECLSLLFSFFTFPFLLFLSIYIKKLFLIDFNFYKFM